MKQNQLESIRHQGKVEEHARTLLKSVALGDYDGEKNHEARERRIRCDDNAGIDIFISDYTERLGAVSTTWYSFRFCINAARGALEKYRRALLLDRFTSLRIKNGTWEFLYFFGELCTWQSFSNGQKHIYENMSKLGSLAEGTMGKSKLPPMGKHRQASNGGGVESPTTGARSTATSESILDPSFSGRMVRPNLVAGGDRQSSGSDDGQQQFEIGAHGYGKSSVKLLYVRRADAPRHEIREYEVDVHLRLGSQRDYLEGDNRDIIATDSQKNTVYLMAKKHGVRSPEEFGILLCAHFLYQYRHVEEVNVNVEEYPWQRHRAADGRAHNHAFVFTPTATRYCRVTQLRNESPRIRGGLKDLRVLKTTQSSFTDFIEDDYRTLPDMNDRIFSTIVTASWDFSTAKGVDFDGVWQTVKDCILENFAGPADTGIYSPSVQNTLYLAEKCVLSKVQQISSIEMEMPNKHYFDIDFSKFSRLVTNDIKEVYLPIDKPSGIIYAQLNRKSVTSKL